MKENNNLYDILEAGSDFNQQQIKKAYFKILRKYPPERFPEEFKKIREAYEILRNEKTRKEYDDANKMDVQLRWAFEKGRKAYYDKDYDVAIDLLSKARKMAPNISIIKNYLGLSYLGRGNTNKAIDALKSLVDDEPRNPVYLINLGNAYLERGWQLKAEKVFSRAKAIDDSYVDIWMGLCDAKIMSHNLDEAEIIIREGIDNSKREQNENISFYKKVVELDIMKGNKEMLVKDVDDMINVSKENEQTKENVTYMLIQLVKFFLNIESITYAEIVLEKVLALNPENKEAKALYKQIDKNRKLVNLYKELEKLNKVEPGVMDIVGLHLFDYHPEDQACIDNVTRKFIEYDSAFYEGSIIYLKNKYFELYRLEFEFFENILKNPKREISKKQHNKLIKKANQIEKIYNINNAYLDYEEDDYVEYDYEYEQKTYVSDEKIGRNDPCPCGSGKKYKKCCLNKE